MPDISMCKGEHCVIAELCYRHTAEPNDERQAWLLLSKEEQGGNCKHYEPNDEAIKYAGECGVGQSTTKGAGR